MIIDDEIRNMTVPERFFAYAHAYRTASAALCRNFVVDGVQPSWSDAAVILMLAAHAVELWLKGAIQLRRTLDGLANHNLEALSAEYLRTLPERELAWESPFKTEYLGISEQEVEALSRKQPAPSILYRYPVDKAGDNWEGLYGFVPEAFDSLLEHLRSDMRRLQALLARPR